MKILLFTLIFILFSFVGFSQNYYEQYKDRWYTQWGDVQYSTPQGNVLFGHFITRELEWDASVQQYRYHFLIWIYSKSKYTNGYPANMYMWGIKMVINGEIFADPQFPNGYSAIIPTYPVAVMFYNTYEPAPKFNYNWTGVSLQ